MGVSVINIGRNRVSRKSWNNLEKERCDVCISLSINLIKKLAMPVLESKMPRRRLMTPGHFFIDMKWGISQSRTCLRYGHILPQNISVNASRKSLPIWDSCGCSVERSESTGPARCQVHPTEPNPTLQRTVINYGDKQHCMAWSLRTDGLLRLKESEFSCNSTKRGLQ